MEIEIRVQTEPVESKVNPTLVYKCLLKYKSVYYILLQELIQDGIKPKPPAFNSREKAFERWKTEIEMWSEVIELTKSKMGIAVALSLPEHDSTMIREQVLEEVPLADLKKDDGLKTLLTFMEKKLGKDDTEDCLEKYEEFKQCKRESDQTINEFIHEFEQKYYRILKKVIKLPEARNILSY